jgi:hypothetical protein
MNDLDLFVDECLVIAESASTRAREIRDMLAAGRAAMGEADDLEENHEGASNGHNAAS